MKTVVPDLGFNPVLTGWRCDQVARIMIDSLLTIGDGKPDL